MFRGVENLFDEMFDDFDDDFWGRTSRRALPAVAGHPIHSLMRTDVSENDDNYELKIDLPGYDKDDIKVKYDDGMLTVSAEKTSEKSEKDKDSKKSGRVIREERYVGAVSRSWYVGDDIDRDKISAKYDRGVLTLSVPKAEKKELPDDKKYIAIEGK